MLAIIKAIGTAVAPVFEYADDCRNGVRHGRVHSNVISPAKARSRAHDVRRAHRGARRALRRNDVRTLFPLEPQAENPWAPKAVSAHFGGGCVDAGFEAGTFFPWMSGVVNIRRGDRVEMEWYYSDSEYDHDF